MLFVSAPVERAPGFWARGSVAYFRVLLFVVLLGLSFLLSLVGSFLLACSFALSFARVFGLVAPRCFLDDYFKLVGACLMACRFMHHIRLFSRFWRHITLPRCSIQVSFSPCCFHVCATGHFSGCVRCCRHNVSLRLQFGDVSIS